MLDNILSIDCLSEAQFSHLWNGDKDTYLDRYCTEWQSVSLIIAYASTQHIIDAGIDNDAADGDNSGNGDGGAGWVSMGLFLSIQYFEVHDSSLWLGSSTQTQQNHRIFWLEGIIKTFFFNLLYMTPKYI